jgi:hypothetical protein
LDPSSTPLPPQHWEANSVSRPSTGECLAKTAGQSKPSQMKRVHRSPRSMARQLHLPHLQEKPIRVGSDLERDFVHVASLFSSVVTITHQPVKWVSEDASYTPCFWVFFRDGSQLLVEVKSDRNVEKCRPLLGSAGAEVNGIQTPFIIVTDHHLKSGPRTANARLIHRYAKTSFPAADCERVLQRVNESNSGISVKELCSSTGVSREVILHLVACRRLALSPDLALEPRDRVFPVQESKSRSHATAFKSWINAQGWPLQRVEIDHAACDLALLRLASLWADACRPSQRRSK